MALPDGEQDWIYPSGSQCMGCHTQASGYTLGLELGQLNTGLNHPAAGPRGNQLASLNACGLFTILLPHSAELPALPSPADPAESLEARARSCLDVNCAICHQPGEIRWARQLDLRHETPMEETGLYGEPGLRFGIKDSGIVAPGAPDRSIILVRMGRTWVNHSRDLSLRPTGLSPCPRSPPTQWTRPGWS